MNKENISHLRYSVFINLFLVAILSFIVLSEPFRDNSQEDTIRFIDKVVSRIENGQTVLSPEKQLLLANNYRSYVKRNSEIRGLEKRFLFSIIAGIGISLFFQFAILLRIWRNKSTKNLN